MNTRWLLHGLAGCGILLAGPMQAAVVCTGPGYPPGCVAVEAAPAAANPSPGVGYGARGAGLRPAAGPGVGPNYGGPVNVNPMASPGAGPNAGGPVNRGGWR